jgi:formamidopyrimidine-DNA glycosylase
MPELPEVETTRLGLRPHVQGKRIARVTVRDTRLRWPIPSSFANTLRGLTVIELTRRGKYLLWECRPAETAATSRTRAATTGGFVLSHLGMSGTLRVLEAAEGAEPPGKHDHVDFTIDGGTTIRFNDPRRFGAMLWIPGATPTHPLLDPLGPEPLSDAFSGRHLYQLSRGRRVSVKEFVMNGHVVVGVGNIYASESLFRAGIHPTREAGKVSLARYDKLAAAIRETLTRAIRAGGSSLRDYVQANGELGYFQVDAFAYGREGAPCRVCHTPIRHLVQGQRSTYYCVSCQR